MQFINSDDRLETGSTSALVMRMLELRASSHEPDCRQGWPGYLDEFRLGFI